MIVYLGEWWWIWNLGVFVMISLCGLHTCVCSVRCGMVRLGQMYVLSYVCGVFCVGRNL